MTLKFEVNYHPLQSWKWNQNPDSLALYVILHIERFHIFLSKNAYWRMSSDIAIKVNDLPVQSVLFENGLIFEILF